MVSPSTPEGKPITKMQLMGTRCVGAISTSLFNIGTRRWPGILVTINYSVVDVLGGFWHQNWHLLSIVLRQLMLQSCSQGCGIVWALRLQLNLPTLLFSKASFPAMLWILKISNFKVLTKVQKPESAHDSTFHYCMSL